MIVIGLTGGIGSGKSTVSEYLREKNYKVIDADAMAHQITEKGTQTLGAIVSYFGPQILLHDGNLDRKKVASIIFSDEKIKEDYEELTTKVIVSQIKGQIDTLRKQGEDDIIFIDAPLLFEAGVDTLTDLVWLIVADEDVRIARVKSRDNVSSEDVRERIKHQMTPEQQVKLSQEIINNSKGKEDLYLQLGGLINKYARL